MNELSRNGIEPIDCERCDTVLELRDTVENLRMYNEQLAQRAIHDDLTDTFRRNHFFELSARQFNLARRHGRALSVLLLNADHFKSINDRFGHTIGDEVLQHIAALCQENLRGSDIFGRYCGAGFSITLPETAIAEARLVAERIRQSIDTTPLNHDQYGPIHCSVSIGVAAQRTVHHDFVELVNDADTAMLEAKRQGRNRIHSHGNPTA